METEGYMPPEAVEETKKMEASQADRAEEGVERADGLEAFVAQLGYVESPELRQLRAQLTEALRNNAPETQELFMQYQQEAEASLELLQGEAYALAQIGLILQKAVVYMDAGLAEEAQSEISDARMYAEGLNRDDLVVAIDAL